MHRDYAASSIKRHERQFGSDADWFFVKYIITCEGEFGALTLLDQIADELDDDKIRDIAATVRSIKNGVVRNGHRRYTDKQINVLAIALLEKYSSARGIGAAIWGLTDEEINEAEL